MKINALDNDAETKFASTKLYVKFMVSLRCKLIVKSEIENLGFTYKISSHGALDFSEGLSDSQFLLLKKNLKKSGMVLLSESESMLIHKIINTIVEVIQYSDKIPKLSFSEIISKQAVVGKESILKIFSDVKGMSVLQFIVIQKIERVKELLLYDDMPLSEIAELLNYKSKHSMLAQFKKITGLTPSDFKRIKKERLKIAEKYSKSANLDTAGNPRQPNS